MKKTVLLFVSVVWTAGAFAQSGGRIAGVSRELARVDFASPSGGARIEVKVTDDAARAIEAADSGSGRASVTAYGVRIFSDSSQDGRANAQAAMGRFAESYPGIDVRMSYETPAFWVTVGHFVDRIDAVALCGRVQGQFRGAFVVPMEVPVAEIIAHDKIEPPASDPESEPGRESGIAIGE